MGLINKLADIKLVLFDVDGVLTDGSLHIGTDGEVIKPFNVKDGLAIELLRTHGILTGVVSGKSSDPLDYRCKQLGFDVVITGCKNKLPRVIQTCEYYQIDLNNLAFCGDDVLDLLVMNECGVSFAPKDAHQLVLANADVVTTLAGGQGVAREVADQILLSKEPDLEKIYAPLLEKIKLEDIEGLEQ